MDKLLWQWRYAVLRLLGIIAWRLIFADHKVDKETQARQENALVECGITLSAVEGVVKGFP